MSLSKRAFGVRGFEEYIDRDYNCIVHGYEDRSDKGNDNSIDITVDGKPEKVCPTCFHYKLHHYKDEIHYYHFKKDGEKFIPIK